MSKKKQLLDIVWIILITVAAGTVMMLLCKVNPVEGFQMFFQRHFRQCEQLCRNFCESDAVDSYRTWLCSCF